MTEYAYKWVSAINVGAPDWEALKRAAERGWEPVPEGEIPPPSVTDTGLDMTPEQLAHFRLHRMPVAEHERKKADLEFLNAALLDPMVHTLIGRKNIRAEIEALRAAGVKVGKIWDLPDDDDDEELLRRVEIAYKFLHDRGLA